MTKHTYFNVSLTMDMIAQAYKNNESYDSDCFIVADIISNNLPTGFKINEAYLDENENLIVDYDNNTEYDVTFFIENGFLYVKFMKGDKGMSLVDLGNVIGPQGATGPQGPQGETGATGAQGPKGDDGISPTFVLGDGSSGTIAGHLYADYDNPYVPS